MLEDDQFLKIRRVNGKGAIEMEIFEFPKEKWRRPFRWRKFFHPLAFNNPQRTKEMNQAKISTKFLALLFSHNTNYHSPGGIDSHVNSVIEKHKQGG